MDLNILEVFVDCGCGFGILSKGPQVEIECPECGAIYLRQEYRVSKIKDGRISQEVGDSDGTDL